jgi:hypothetical protein
MPIEPFRLRVGGEAGLRGAGVVQRSGRDNSNELPVAIDLDITVAAVELRDSVVAGSQ